MFKKIREQFNMDSETRNLTKMMLPSILGMILCVICLAGSTFAWFTASQSTSVGELKTAEFEVTIEDNGQPISLDSESKVELTGPEEHKITLTASGTASKGYCVIYIDDAKYIGRFVKDTNGEYNTIKFTVNSSKAQIRILDYWGDVPYTLKDVDAIPDGTIGTASENNVNLTIIEEQEIELETAPAEENAKESSTTNNSDAPEDNTSETETQQPAAGTDE